MPVLATSDECNLQVHWAISDQAMHGAIGRDRLLAAVGKSKATGGCPAWHGMAYVLQVDQKIAVQPYMAVGRT